MAGGPSKLRETTKPDGDEVWNGFRTIEDSIVYLKTQRSDRQTNLDPKNV